MPVHQRNLFAVPVRLRRLQIEITTGCNLRCAGCQRTVGMAAGSWRNAHMPAQRFAAVLDNAPPADTIILQGIGEPTLHPDLPQLIATARGAGKFGAISFNTNALVRDLEYYRHLRTVGLNHVSVSVDSLDPATAEATRAGTDCARLTEAIQALLGLFGPTVTLSIVLSRHNAGELPALLRRLYALGGRCVEVQPLVGYGATTRPLCLTASELDLARRQIAEARATLPGLQMLPAAALTPNGNRCRRPLHAAYVTVDGFLTPCCITNDASLFGGANLAETSFDALWQSEGLAGWLHAYVDREPAICPGCAFNPVGAPPAALGDAEQWLRDGRLDAAEAGFRAIAGDARNTGALQGIGLVRLQRGDAAGALPWLRAAFALLPDARAGHNLSTALATLGRIDEAVAISEHVVTAHPDYVPARFALAGMLAGRDNPRAATLSATLCERAVQAQRFDLVEQCVAWLEHLPVANETSLRLANLLRGAGRRDLALRLLRPILRDGPDDIAARLVAAMSLLPVVYATADEAAATRADYARALMQLDGLTAAATRERLAAAIGQVGNAKPFFLAYQGEDDRALQQIYGRIVSRIARAGRTAPALAPSVSRERLRIGFASAYFHLHSVSKLFGGWMRHLDRSRFEVFGYQLGADVDATSRSLAACCAEYRYGTASAAAWAEQIAADRLDVLIYPELGMHPLPVQLGCLRLAPVQCTTWGHPVTSGLPTMDYYLSSEAMEPPDGDAHYTERLVRLPGLGICYAARRSPARHWTGLLGAARRRGCVSLLPVAVQIPAALRCRLAPHRRARAGGAVPVHRIEQRRRGCGVPGAVGTRVSARQGWTGSRHCALVPTVPHDTFASLLRAGDVFLDSIGWSGATPRWKLWSAGCPL